MREGRRPLAGDVQLQMPPDFDVDDEVDKLHGKVSMLKQMTGAIHEETSIRGKLIDQLEETMANVGDDEGDEEEAGQGVQAEQELA